MPESIRYHTMTDKRAAVEKRLRHEIAADAIRKNPALIGHALDMLATMERRYGPRPYIDQWRELLQKPERMIRAEIVKDTEAMDELRNDSPFYQLAAHGLDFTDVDERRALTRRARLVAEADQSDVMKWNGR